MLREHADEHGLRLLARAADVLALATTLAVLAARKLERDAVVVFPKALDVAVLQAHGMIHLPFLLDGFSSGLRATVAKRMRGGRFFKAS